ncbi:MAG: nitroreductase family protein [Candidatus Thorarchaeota archaeon]
MPKTNIVLDTINNRRSIREYLDKPVTDEVLSQILEAGFRAPFAAQLCSVIYTRSREKMKEAGIGVYPTPPVHMIFFIDLVRLEKIMTHRGRPKTSIPSSRNECRISRSRGGNCDPTTVPSRYGSIRGRVPRPYRG